MVETTRTSLPDSVTARSSLLGNPCMKHYLYFEGLGLIESFRRFWIVVKVVSIGSRTSSQNEVIVTPSFCTKKIEVDTVNKVLHTVPVEGLRPRFPTTVTLISFGVEK